MPTNFFSILLCYAVPILGVAVIAYRAGCVSLYNAQDQSWHKGIAHARFLVRAMTGHFQDYPQIRTLIRGLAGDEPSHKIVSDFEKMNAVGVTHPVHKTEDFSDRFISVNKCARCGEDHEDLRFAEFGLPIDPDSPNTLTHWATCPVSLDPILLRFIADTVQVPPAQYHP